MGGEGAEFLANMEKSDPQIEAASEKQLGPGGPEDKAVREAERELEEVDGSSRRSRRTTGVRRPATTIGPAPCPRASA